jgi:glyoxylase-like metal-dependent hydrolase (beta-lactamase superfamily II)
LLPTLKHLRNLIASAGPVSDENARAFKIGEFAALALKDGTLQFANDGKTFGVGHAPEEVAALLARAHLPSNQLDLSIQPLLVKAGGRVLLFDTGAGANMGASGGKLPKSLAAASVDPGSVTDIFISHAHGDHVGGLLTASGAPAFPAATIHLSSPEWAYLKSLNAKSAETVAITKYTALLAAIEPKVATFAPGAEIIPGIVKAVEIKGHTPGHSGYLITSNQDSLLYIGDAMHHYVVSVQKPDWTINFDADAATAETSRNALLAKSADTRQRIYAVHFPFPGIGRIKRSGESFVWIAEK